MLIGAHVSPAGGLAKAIERGEERGEAIQIFNQSPRMWRPTAYGEEDFAAFREAMRSSRIDAVLIHAVYLLNCASDDADIRAKSLVSLTHSLRVGRAIGASGVVLHPGSAKAGDVGEAIARAGETIARALADSEGVSFTSRTPPVLVARSGARSMSWPGCWTRPAGTSGSGCAWTPAICSPRAMTSARFDGMGSVLRECTRKLGAGRIRSLHCNDSQTPLGSNRDRHANIGAGELGEQGCMAFLSAPGLQKLPCVLETPGENREGPSREEVALAMELRERGLRARKSAGKLCRSGARSAGDGSGDGRPGSEDIFQLGAQRRRVLHAERLPQPQPAKPGGGIDVEHDLGGAGVILDKLLDVLDRARRAGSRHPRARAPASRA